MSKRNLKLLGAIYGSGLNMVKVAKLAGMKTNTLSRTCNNGSELGVRKALRVAKVLNTTAEELFVEDE